MSLKDRNKKFQLGRNEIHTNLKKLEDAGTGTTLQDICNAKTAAQLKAIRLGHD